MKNYTHIGGYETEHEANHMATSNINGALVQLQDDGLYHVFQLEVAIEGLSELSVDQLKEVRKSYEIQRSNATTREAQDGYTKFLMEVAYWLGRNEQADITEMFYNG